MADLKLLFVCSRNQWRSPTGERIWWKTPNVSARSAGTSKSARHRVTAEDILWADLIFAMEETHKTRVRERFRQELTGKEVHVLDIPDDYGFMDPELITLIETATLPLVEAALGDA